MVPARVIGSQSLRPRPERRGDRLCAHRYQQNPQPAAPAPQTWRLSPASPQQRRMTAIRRGPRTPTPRAASAGRQSPADAFLVRPHTSKQFRQESYAPVAPSRRLVAPVGRGRHPNTEISGAETRKGRKAEPETDLTRRSRPVPIVPAQHHGGAGPITGPSSSKRDLRIVNSGGSSEFAPGSRRIERCRRNSCPPTPSPCRSRRRLPRSGRP